MTVIKPRIALLAALVFSLGIFLWLRMSQDGRESAPSSVDKGEVIAVTTPPSSDGSTSGQHPASSRSEESRQETTGASQPGPIGSGSVADQKGHWMSKVAHPERLRPSPVLLEKEPLEDIESADLSELSVKERFLDILYQ